MGLFLFCCISDVLISSTFSGNGMQKKSVHPRERERFDSAAASRTASNIHFGGCAFLKGVSAVRWVKDQSREKNASFGMNG